MQPQPPNPINLAGQVFGRSSRRSECWRIGFRAVPGAGPWKNELKPRDRIYADGHLVLKWETRKHIKKDELTVGEVDPNYTRSLSPERVGAQTTNLTAAS